MQEIIPTIERTWRESSRENEHVVTVIDIDTVPLSECTAIILSADQVVITCFTVKLARVAQFLRNNLSWDGRFIIYLHNQATISCWPLFQWGLGNNLWKKDIFISSSDRDAKTQELNFKAPHIKILPFTLPEENIGPMNAHSPGFPIRFVYSGRISSQKNLHTLLMSYRLFLDQMNSLSSKLIFYGGEDNLGSPHQAIKGDGYQLFLDSLVESLKLKNHVEFCGHLERDELHEKLKEHHILVTASLHSDENFGMSVLRSLCMGAPVVATSWGGHDDFSKHFSNQISLVKVHKSSNGPWVDIQNFAQAMKDAIAKIHHLTLVTIPEYYQRKSVSMKIFELSKFKNDEIGLLQQSELSKNIFSQKEQIEEKEKHPTKIFHGYKDPLAQPFFAAYGMNEEIHKDDFEGAHFWAVPYLVIESKIVKIYDPHKDQVILQDNGLPTVKLLGLDGLSKGSVSYEMAILLKERGYAGVKEGALNENT